MKTQSLKKSLCALISCLALNAQALPEIVNEDSAELPAIFEQATGKATLKATKVAELDAQRKLTEKIYGFYIAGHGTVLDFVLEDATLKQSVSASLRGATQIGSEKFNADGIVYVTYGVAMADIFKQINISLKKQGKKTIYSEKHQLVSMNKRIVKALGNGALPGSPGLIKIRAKRAAEVDAYGKMAARIMGIQIDAKTTVRDLCLANDKISSSLAASLKGLKIIKVNYKKKSCEVTVELKIRETIERLEHTIRKHKKGTDVTFESLKKVNTEIVDRIFTTKGSGAFVESGSVLALDETLIFKKLLKKEIVVE